MLLSNIKWDSWGGGIHQLDVLSVLILTADKQKLNSENFF